MKVYPGKAGSHRDSSLDRILSPYWGAEFSLSKLALHPYLHMHAAMRVQVRTLVVGQFLIHNGVSPQINSKEQLQPNFSKLPQNKFREYCMAHDLI